MNKIKLQGQTFDIFAEQHKHNNPSIEFDELIIKKNVIRYA